MKSHSVAHNNFDLIRVTKSKQAVDVCSNTIRVFFKRGLPAYRSGKAVFFSRTELEQFLKRNAAITDDKKAA